MLHLFDPATMARAYEPNLDRRLQTLLTSRIGALGADLIDWTEYLIVESGDTESDIMGHIGFSPLIDPISRLRFGDEGFQPCWDYLTRHDCWFEMVVTFGSTFACVLFIENTEGTLPDLLALCRLHA